MAHSRVTEGSLCAIGYIGRKIERERLFKQFIDMIGTVASAPDSTIPGEDRRF
jgi:hypothetical protein